MNYRTSSRSHSSVDPILIAKLILLATLVTISIGCWQQDDVETARWQSRSTNEETVVKTKLAERNPGTTFTLLESTGIDFENSLNNENQIPYLTNGAGVSIGDYDNDGLADIFFAGQDVANRLYRQTDDFQFEDVSAKAGVTGQRKIAGGATFVDINNDGFLDIYVCNYLTNNELFINQKDGTFKEQAWDFGLSYSGPTTMAAFMDYDLDGDLDVYLVNNRRYRQEKEQAEKKLIRKKGGQVQMPPHMFFKLEGRWIRTGHRDLLFRNDDGKYSIVNDETGVGDFGSGLSATWFDVNNDNWPDLWVGNDLKSPDHLYINQQDGTFKDALPEMVSYTTWNSMGADFADFNNDGMFDLLVADMSATSHYKEKTNMGEMDSEAWFLASSEPRQFMRNCLYVNNGTNRLMESAYISGLARTDWTWSVKCSDFDCDGNVDVFISNGMVDNSNDADWGLQMQALIEDGKKEEALKLSPPKLIEKNLAFKNVGNLKFKNVSAEWGLDLESISHGAAVGDLDNDGDLDLVVNNFQQPASIYRNDMNSGTSVVVELIGQQSNCYGIGSRVTLNTSAGPQHRMLSSARGYMSSDQLLIHFGLQPDTEIENLVIDWPSGIRQTVSDVEPGFRYRIKESGSKPAAPSAESTALPAFAETNHIQFKHEESDFDDFSSQLLLPNRLSTHGPGAAWADVNGDGQMDVFAGGAAGQSGKMFVRRDGKFSESEGPWSEQAASEDMGIAWLDVDSDGDLDLFVASGSYEHIDDDSLLRNRLYLNDGSGSFSDATDKWLPDDLECSGAVAVGDFDRDDDLDLFIATRVSPGKYPTCAASRILKNEGEKFVDATEEVGSEVSKLRLVTDATWIDFNNDGWTDLITCSEWGPVSIFQNDKGKLTDRTSDFGLADETGWWNGISLGDFDNNGFVDIVATNFGLNTKYGSPSKEKPVSLFYGDMDSDGNIELVEAKKKNDQLLPVRGRSCSCHQLPDLKEKFPSYHDFALAELEDIYELSETQELKCTNLNSVLLLNFGDRMEIKPLPYLAQLAPSFGSVAADFNGDGNMDLFTLQNFYGPQVETGRMSGGLSAMLLGNGDGTFQELWPADSGLIIPEDARSVTLCELDGNNRPDLMVTSCDSSTRCFTNQFESAGFARIRLQGKPGNANAIGANVKISHGDKSTVTKVTQGTGYLAQSIPDIFVARSENHPLNISVTWPDGTETETTIKDFDNPIVLSQKSQSKISAKDTSENPSD